MRAETKGRHKRDMSITGTATMEDWDKELGDSMGHLADKVAGEDGVGRLVDSAERALQAARRICRKVIEAVVDEREADRVPEQRTECEDSVLPAVTDFFHQLESLLDGLEKCG